VGRSIALSLVVLSLIGLASVTADEPARGKKGSSSPAPESTMAAREAVVLPFVRTNHPELADLLEQLKAMRPVQYERAIAELWQTTRMLANFKKNDERRYQAALDLWKARSRAELLAAELVGAPNPERETQLRAALDNQIAAELRQQRLERELLAARLRKLDETIERLETKRDAVVETRYQNLLSKGRRARRLEAGQATP
jgi:hypothetical protein